MSLRLRLLLMIGVSLSVLWAAVAIWMLRSLDDEVHRTLDQRLMMSAHMVAGLMSQHPNAWKNGGQGIQQDVSTLQLPNMVERSDCQVSSLHGEVLARTPGATPEALASVVPGYSERNIKGERWRSYTYEADGLRVTTADRLAERHFLLHNVMIAAILPFLVAMGGSLIVLWIAVKNGLLPLERLRQILASRAPNVLTPVSVTPMSPDLLPLVSTLNQLLERISTTISRERRFISDAAHELRTPLTAIKTHLQVARITQGQDAAQALDYAQEGVARLQRTLTQLLTLSQIEGPFSWDEGKAVDAEQVARLAMRDATANGPKRIVLKTDASSTQLNIPEALAVTALRNLLDNALRHTPADQDVELEIRLAENTCVFFVRDHGPGLSTEELTMVTQRFWRRGPGHGSGLGLSIVSAITEHFGGHFEIAQLPQGGLEARLTLPIVHHQ